jgi:tetratricopeptide (TPR) repeat protein
MKEALGDKSGMSRAIGNMGEVHREQGRYTEAMVFYERQLAMAESLGDKQGMSNALGGMGLIHHVQGCYAEALHSYRSAFEVHREIGFQKGMTYWLEGIARTLLKLVEGGDSSRRDVLRTSQPTPENSTMTGDMRSTSLREARENAEECVRISQEIGKPDTLFSGRVLLARIDAAEGNVAQAAEKLEAMLAEATDEEQIADLYYWLWKIDPGLSFPRTRESRPQDSDWPDLDSRVRGNDIEGTHRSEALRLYESLYSRIPKFEFVKRIAELKGEHVPMSADDLETS